MRKPTKKQLTQRLFDACSKWLRLLWVGDWDLTVLLADLNDDGAESPGEGFKNEAEVAIQVPYKMVTITGDEATIASMSDRALDETACHEVMHVVISPLGMLMDELIDELPAAKRDIYRKWKKRELEDVTASLTNAVRALHRAPKGR